MSTKVNKGMIGAFVLGALALAVAGVIALGSGMFFTKKFKFIMFFDNSVSGLTIGAPVVFRGVPIGLVTEIGVIADPHNLHFYIPVTIELQSGLLNMSSGKGSQTKETLMDARKEGMEEVLKDLVEKGLRAQLVTQSFVTGQLAVSLDLMPNTQARLVGASKLPEIPTVPSMFDELSQTLKHLPLEELVNRLIGAVTGIEKFINSPQMAQVPANLDAALIEFRTLTQDIRTRVDPLSKSVDGTLKSYKDLADNLDQRSSGLTGSVNNTLKVLDAALKDGRQTLTKMDKVVSPDSPTVTDLNKALSEIAAAARSIRTLADYLERHPEALIQGKGTNRR
ncbi:MlaD family protein [Fundidesulfovibrio putealis]|uniref:MlaD family protein n=1 Tax=Fundidesulfovibrio putealis TaxID=270496 RepID=UPI0003FFE943|nr:MlaD family protein [Fundidesulfovibrio putealis]